MRLLRGKPPNTPMLREEEAKIRRRNKRVEIHLTEEEHTHLKEQVALSGFTTEQFIRNLIDGVEIRPRPPDELPELLAQLSAIGNNIKQIARIANSRKYVTKGEMEYVEQLLKEIWERVKKC